MAPFAPMLLGPILLLLGPLGPGLPDWKKSTQVGPIRATSLPSYLLRGVHMMSQFSLPFPPKG